MRTKPASLLPEENVARAPVAPKSAAKKKAGPAEPLRFYRVAGGPSQAGNQNNIGPFRREQGDYFLKLGNEISSGEYNIKELLNHGCKLEEIETPGWFLEAQEKAQERAQDLRDAGIEIGETPDFEATPLKKAAGKSAAASDPAA